MTDQLFKDEEANPQATPEQITPSVNPNDLFSDQLAAIKNEDGVPKYDTVEKAIEALQHSQQYIPELKTKMSEQEQVINELKVKLEATKKVEDIISGQTPQQEGQTTNQPLDKEAIAQLVGELLQEKSSISVQEDNQAKVNKALSERYGANAAVEVQKRAQELGMKPSEIGDLSKRNPAAALALFGEKIGSTPTVSNSYSISTDSTPREPVKAPAKSVLSGATTKEQAAHMAEIKKEVYRKFGITE